MTVRIQSPSKSIGASSCLAADFAEAVADGVAEAVAVLNE